MRFKIQNALRKLGVKSWRTAYAVTWSNQPYKGLTVEVYCNGEYFGLWDNANGRFVERREDEA
jgi:hypothetical protein